MNPPPARSRLERETGIGAFALAVALAVGATACSGASQRTRSRSVAAAPFPALALTLVESPVPRLPAQHYQTSGTYPQVAGPDLDASVVNSALRAAVRRDQREYTRWVRRRPGPLPPALPGIYRIGVERALSSASSRVVSALLPAQRLAPGGNHGTGWLSVTVEVPSGKPVEIRDLFARPAGGLAALAVAFETLVLAGDDPQSRCVRASLSAAGFSPTAFHYRYFALTPKGLAIGFEQGQVSASVCSRLVATVPYPALRRYWSERANRLIAGVRRPHG